MPAISGHNGRVLVFPQKIDRNQGDEDYASSTPIALMANRWQFSYKTELLETTTYENPRAPLVTPLSSRVAGLTDIDFSFDAFWDTVTDYAHPLGWPDLRPGTRPAIALEIKKGLNRATAAPHISNPTSGLSAAVQPSGKLGEVNPIGQYFYFVALITECQISTEVKGVVTYSVSGKATPYVTNDAYGHHELRTGTFLPSDNNGGLPFSSQDYFYQDVITD
jgi:hypothetical protein